MLGNDEVQDGRRPRVMVYARVARNEQDALGHQIALLVEEVARRGWTLSESVAEGRAWGVSCPALTRICDCDVVMVRDWSRLSRTAALNGPLARRLRAAGVEVVFPDDGSRWPGPAADAGAASADSVVDAAIRLGEQFDLAVRVARAAPESARTEWHAALAKPGGHGRCAAARREAQR